MLVGTMESKILYIETGCIRWRQELCWLLMPGHLRPHHKYAVTELSWGLSENANCGIQVFRTVSSLLFCFKYTTILDAALYGQSPAASCWPGAGCDLWPLSCPLSGEVSSQHSSLLTAADLGCVCDCFGFRRLHDSNYAPLPSFNIPLTALETRIHAAISYISGAGS